MAYEHDGNTIETTEKGYLVNIEDWNEGLGSVIAAAEDVEMTDRHWDVVKYLRSEFIENRENQPNTRAILKAMAEEWGAKPSQKELYGLFPQDPSKQAGKIGGLPESKRKGGY